MEQKNIPITSGAMPTENRSQNSSLQAKAGGNAAARLIEARTSAGFLAVLLAARSRESPLSHSRIKSTIVSGGPLQAGGRADRSVAG